MLPEFRRWLFVAVIVMVPLMAKAAPPKSTVHGTLTHDEPGVDSMGNLSNAAELMGPVTIKYTANIKTGKFAAHGTGLVINQFGQSKTFTDPILDFTGNPFSLTNIHAIYTVKANGHCTVKVTATFTPPCGLPADDECVDSGSGSLEKDLRARRGAVDAGRLAIPSVVHCLNSRQVIFATGPTDDSR